MNQQHHDKITIKYSTNNTINIKKLKLIQTSQKQFKLSTQIMNKSQIQIQINHILHINSLNDLHDQYVYQIPSFNFQTLRQHLNSDKYIKLPYQSRFDLLFKIANPIIVAFKYLLNIDPNYILTPQKIILTQQNVLLSPFAFKQQNMFYDPQYSGIKKQNSTVWSTATVFDEIIRGKPFFEEDQSYTQLQQLEDQELREFFLKVLNRNQSIDYQIVHTIFKRNQKVDLLMCPFHKQKVVKVDLIQKKFFCEKCFNEEFYELQIQKAESRKLMDQTIESYKKLNKKFEKIIKLTKGQQMINTRTLKLHIQNLSRQLVKQYNQHLQTIKFNEMEPLEEQMQLDRVVQNLEAFKEELIQKYQKKIKRKLIDEIRSQISNN